MIVYMIQLNMYITTSGRSKPNQNGHPVARQLQYGRGKQCSLAYPPQYKRMRLIRHNNNNYVISVDIIPYFYALKVRVKYMFYNNMTYK